MCADDVNDAADAHAITPRSEENIRSSHDDGHGNSHCYGCDNDHADGGGVVKVTYTITTSVRLMTGMPLLMLSPPLVILPAVVSLGDGRDPSTVEH